MTLNEPGLVLAGEIEFRHGIVPLAPAVACCRGRLCMPVLQQWYWGDAVVFDCLLSRVHHEVETSTELLAIAINQVESFAGKQNSDNGNQCQRGCPLEDAFLS